MTESAPSRACASIDASKSVTLDCAYEEASQVKARYMAAVRDQGNALPLLSAGLIGLAAVTLYKGATHPNTRDMVGAGVLGSTALAYGNTQLSKPRLDVYRAGADALMCAMTAVEPLRPGQATLGAITDDATKATLYGRRAAVVAKRNTLQSLLRQHAELNRDTEEDKPGEPVCKTELKAAPCPGLKKPGLSEDEAKLERARCSLLPKISKQHCTAAASSKITIPPPPRVTDAFNAANEEVKAANQQIEDALVTMNAMRDAGPLLAKKSQDIQLAVSAEVDKTVPNLSAVMAAAGGLRDTAFSITGAPALKPGGLQGDAKSLAMPSQNKAAVSAIEIATAELNDARVALGELAALSVGADHAQVRKTLNDCAFKMSGVQIVVTPSADSATVPIGGKTVFFAFVSGAGSMPTATATGPQPAVVNSGIEGGQFRFEFSPPQGAKAGDKFKLTFSAATGPGPGATVVERVIEVIVAAPPGSSKAEEPPKAAINPAPVPAPAPTADKGKFKELTKDNLAALGLTDSASEEVIQKAIDRCQATAKPAIALSRNFDTATKKALADKTCQPGG